MIDPSSVSHILRLAEEVTEDLTQDPSDLRKMLQQADRLFSPSAWRRIIKAFTLRGLPFFQFYIDLYKVRLGVPYEGNLKQDYKRAADRIAMIRSPIDKQPLSPTAVNAIALTRPIVNRVLTALTQGRESDPMVWVRFNAAFIPVLIEVAKDKGVFLTTTRLPGREKWAIFRPMSAKQEKIERLRDEDPEAFTLMQQKGEALEQINTRISERIQAEGKEVKSAFLAGHPVLVGIDPATGEEFVYDLDGDVIPKGDYIGKVRAKAESQALLSRVPNRTQVNPNELRILDEDALEQLPGEVEWTALTDDKAKQGRLTRILPTKWTRKFIQTPEGLKVEEYKVIVEGRYKGVFLDDMINSEGRLIEGTAFKFHTRGNKVTKIPRKMDPSEREPYVTVAEVVEHRMFQFKKIPVTTQKLFLKIDGSRQNAGLRNAIKSLACNVGTQRGCIPSLTYEPVEGSKGAAFYFEPKDFGLIMQSLQGMSLSKAALDMVQGYYQDLARAEAATKNLDAYAPDALASESDKGEKFQFIKGSFNKAGEWEAFNLRLKQREALAWMDANGNSGVCALETGVGKTAVGIGMMLKLVRDGLAEGDSSYTRPDGVTVTTNGRFLFVCPTSLMGNIKKEVRNLLSDPTVMLEKLDVLSYNQYSRASKTGRIPDKLKGIPFWKARAAALGGGRQARHNEVESYQGFRAYWNTNHPSWRIYGVVSEATGADVARILYDKKTRTWEVQDINHKRLETFTAQNDQEGVKRALMTISRRVARTAAGDPVKPWDPALYSAIFFDEAQALKNPSSGASQAALRLYHPRKVCLTASPMERNPMEAYVLAAITNNRPLFGPGAEAVGNRQEMRRFKERFCEVVGGRIVGIKQDSMVQRDLHTWVKRNVFYADKTDIAEYNLPKPEVQVLPVYMPEMVETLYRDVAGQFSIMMQGAARKFSQRTRGDAYADQQAERLFSKALAPVIKLLTDMANRPQKALEDIIYAVKNGSLPNFVDADGQPMKLPKAFLQVIQKWAETLQAQDLADTARVMGNPKIQAAEDLLASKLESVEGSRALLFSDDRQMCLEAGEHLSKTLGGTHVVALSDAIYFFRGGNPLPQWIYPLDQEMMRKLHPSQEEQDAILSRTRGLTVHDLPFGKKSYKKYPDLRGKQGVNTHYVADEWQQFVLKEIVHPDPSIVTCTLLGKVYMYGHNLQGFNTVVHLDRNNWNSESMKQRTARAWRQGQTEVVQEVTIDMTYAPDHQGVERSEFDVTLDQIRAAFQEMDAGVFDRIIKDAQRIALGSEWEAVAKKDASLWRLDSQVAELLASPYMGRAKAPVDR